MRHWTRGHSIRSLVLMAIVASCIGGICVMGIAQALTAEDQPTPGATPAGPAEAGLVATSSPGSRHRGEAGQTLCTPKYCPRPPLYYRGGKGVQHKPWLFPIFWGKNWNTKGALLKAQLIKMYTDFSGSAYQGILTQYFDSKGHIESTIKVVQPYVDERVVAPSEVTTNGLKAEVGEAITINSWPSSSEGQYIVFTAPGSKYHGTFLGENNGCAYHNQTPTALSYTFVPYEGEEPFFAECSSSNINASNMALASHEYAESATDPFLETGEAAWNTKKEQYEIADICENGINELSDGSWVQGLWDNYKNECALSDPSPAWVYVIGEPTVRSLLTSTGATLDGLINPENMQTKYYFEYGATPSYGMTTPAVTVSPSWETKQFKEAITGLTANTAYYYVLVGKNSKGEAKGRQQKFKTPSMFRSSRQQGVDKTLKFGELRLDGTTAVTTCAASEVKSQWHIEVAGQIKQQQKETTSGPDLLLQIKNWGKCSTKIGSSGSFATEIKECDLRIVQGESEVGYGGVVTPCLVKIGTEGKEVLCEMQIPAGMEDEAESDEGINVGLSETTFDKGAPLIAKVNMASGGLGQAAGEGMLVQQASKRVLCPLPASENAELDGMEVEAEEVESP
jgi:hypothetical protein